MFFEKKLPTKLLRYLLELLKGSIGPLKKLTVKEVALVLPSQLWAGKCQVGKQKRVEKVEGGQTATEYFPKK